MIAEADIDGDGRSKKKESHYFISKKIELIFDYFQLITMNLF